MGKNNILDSYDQEDPESIVYDGVTNGSDANDQVNGNVSEDANSGCFPIGATGHNDDSLPGGSKVLTNYQLVFEADQIEEREVGVCKKIGTPVFVQKAFGTLALYSVSNSGERTEVIKVTAISGSGGNGCIPNNQYSESKQPVKYYAGRLEHGIDFHDGHLHQDANGNWVADNKENGWKIYIYDEFINRGLFRIHPTTMSNGIPSSNDGCISPYPSENSVSFYKEIIKVLTNSKLVIPLIVNIKGNYNITVQIKNYMPKKVE